ncbi:hypothetical protein C8J33_1012292 [Rhizobium sp. PP-CC-3G-465]|nr:hypothetical protein C8J33_1012292 [Rhizobium sp. PP-CC-3G-465]
MTSTAIPFRRSALLPRQALPSGTRIPSILLQS